MSDTRNSNKPRMEGELLEQLLRFQSDIEGQGHLLAMTLNPLAEALDNGGNVSLEIMNHVKAQILRAHLQLDDLEDRVSGHSTFLHI